ncbi:MAG: carboxypeptidase regulatory-like domain-containing protein [Patescibacteria group bacterium]|nr:carboxypeptidase regulatory-like domain-containing protein [Patescibacteria group bacterium]
MERSSHYHAGQSRKTRLLATRLLAVGALAIGVLVGAGCKSSDRPDLGRVEGVVTLDGKPLAEAFVHFDPGTVRGSSGATNAEGKFELTYLRDVKGAAVGEHTVRITTQSETAPETLPARYHAQTTLKAVVKAGQNQFQFDLESQ